MMYFDTASLAKCYLNEHGSKEVRDFAVTGGKIACCEFGRIELAATFHRNLRQKMVSAVEFRLLWKQFDLDEESRLWTWLPVNRELLADVTTRFRKLAPAVYLRSADALILPVRWNTDSGKFTVMMVICWQLPRHSVSRE